MPETINTFYNKKQNKYMSNNKLQIPSKAVAPIIIVIGVLAMSFMPDNSPAVQSGQLNDQPQYEILEAKASELDESGSTKIEEGTLDKEEARIYRELAEIKKAKDSESPKDNAVQVEELSVQQVKTEEVIQPKISTSWQPFVDHAKANPWKGKTFDEGNHLQIATKHIARYTGIEGCHPFLMASIHYSETGLQMHNGANGQGAFQAYSSKIRYPANSPVTDFKDQATRACSHIRAKVGGADLSSLDDINLIGKALALYNGCYSPAIGGYARGNYGTANGWDKCPYTANFLTSNQGMRQCSVDGCRKHNTRQIYGTMSFIAHLKTLNITY